jgi:MoaA/NifB/PqqE/SkfB family radical SAM enzyme
MKSSEFVMRSAFWMASRILYSSPAHADWAFEKIQRPVTSLRILRNIAGYYLRSTTPPTPFSAVIEPVFGCNLRCKTCWGGLDLAGKRPPLMPYELYESAIRQMPRSVESVTFSMLGEPLLHPQLGDMIQLARDSGFRTILFTNGILLRDEQAQMLARAPLDVLNISVETSAEQSRSMRGADLDEIRENARAFAAIKSAGTEIKLSIVAHAGNIADIPHVLDTWKGIAHHLKVSPRMNMDEPGPPRVCMEPWRGNINIFTDGTVSPCCLDAFVDLSIGNLNTEPLADILKGEAWRELLRSTLAGNAPERCSRCSEFSDVGTPKRAPKRNA